MVSAEIRNEVQYYYTELHKPIIMPDVNHKVTPKRQLSNAGSEEISKITIDETKHAIGKIKRNKSGFCYWLNDKRSRKSTIL